MSTYYLSRGDAAMIFHRDHVTNHGRKPVPDTFLPVVVIDPNDRAQIFRLAVAMRDFKPEPLADWELELLGDDREMVETGDRLQAALREFANPTPPKPEEPTTRGAVVKDAKGLEWVRVHPGGAAWVNGYCRWEEWADIDAVEVVRP